MSDIGPDLPPHLLAKRKRKQEEAAKAESAVASGAKDSPSGNGGEKRRRVIGPAMPPAPLDERPPEPPKQAEEPESDDDDGFGPALPTNGAEVEESQEGGEATGANHGNAEPAPSEEKPKRDDWMMMPPKQDDLAARMDPSKQRARGFNTGKGAKGPSAGGDDSSAWYETAEQKQKRLADEMMGVSKPGGSIGPQRQSKATGPEKDEVAASKIREHTEKTRGPSLMDQHQRNKGSEAEDDDPSKRAFDREKDMGSGIGRVQRREMVNKAGDFNSKFSGGSYL